MRFDAAKKSFEINLDGILSASLPEDVESLIRLRMIDLSAQEIEVLQVAACIGPRVTKYVIFDIVDCSIQLSVALEDETIGPDDIEHVLWRALRARFMVPLYTNYAVSVRRSEGLGGSSPGKYSIRTSL